MSPSSPSSFVRPLPGLAVALLLGLVSLTATVRAGGVEPCKVATKGDSPVAKACKEGGVLKAKNLMRAMQATAKEKGMKALCSDCHVNSEDGDYTLTKEATQKFQKMLALTK